MDASSDQNPYLLMSVGSASELWVWLVSSLHETYEALAAAAALATSSGMEKLHVREQVCRRLLAAFEYYVLDIVRCQHDRWTLWFSLPHVGIDEIGLALFARHLTRMTEYWQAKERAPYAPEVLANRAILTPFTQMFFARLGLTMEQVESRAEHLLIDEDRRDTSEAGRAADAAIGIDPARDGFLTYEDRSQRGQLVRLLRERQQGQEAR